MSLNRTAVGRKQGRMLGYGNETSNDKEMEKWRNNYSMRHEFKPNRQPLHDAGLVQSSPFNV